LSAQVDILARRYVSGFGQQQGGLVMHFENKNKKDIAVSYYQAVPWFMKLYFHTLKIVQNGAQIDPKNCKLPESPLNFNIISRYDTPILYGNNYNMIAILLLLSNPNFKIRFGI
jgi:hypothetical protein